MTQHADSFSNEAAEADYARLDLERLMRCGTPEVIFGQGKTSEQIVTILGRFLAAGQNAMVTRASREHIAAARAAFPDIVEHVAARALTLDVAPLPNPVGLVAICTAGTADIPIAEEAALTAARMGAHITRVYDVGVAGLHRLLTQLPILRSARAVIVAAGMEGALPSVVGGLIDRPIIAVPTSVGYGLPGGGQAALWSMLNTCVPGITVVNVDNGFGAGVAAALINRLPERNNTEHITQM